MHYQKTKRDITALDRFLNKEKWHSQVIWMFRTFREYCLLPEKQMRLHCSIMHTFEKTFQPMQMQRHGPIICLKLNWTSFDIYTRFSLSRSPSHCSHLQTKGWCMAATLGQWYKISNCSFARWLDYQPWRVMGKPKIWLCTMLYELGLLK